MIDIGFDTLEEVVRPEHTALLMVDMQNDFCDEAGYFGRGGADLTLVKRAVANTASLLAAAREAGVLIVFIQYTQLAGGLSDSPAYLRRRYKHSGEPYYCVEGSWGQSIPEAIGPKDREIIVKKLRGSSFSNTCLDTILRCHGIRTTVITGLVTEGCVTAAALDAGSRDYFTVVVEDCVGAFRRDLHEAALLIMREREEMSTADELVRIWSKANGSRR